MPHETSVYGVSRCLAIPLSLPLRSVAADLLPHRTSGAGGDIPHGASGGRRVRSRRSLPSYGLDPPEAGGAGTSEIRCLLPGRGRQPDRRGAQRLAGRTARGALLGQHV
jgi:hypothetical protein